MKTTTVLATGIMAALLALTACGAADSEPADTATPATSAVTTTATRYEGIPSGSSGEAFIDRVHDQLGGYPSGMTSIDMITIGERVCKQHDTTPYLSPLDVAKAYAARHDENPMTIAVMVGAARQYICPDTWPIT